MGKTFPRGGGHIPHRKGATDQKSIMVMPAPREVIIPLQQHIGAPCEPIVAVGDMVKMGQKIGESKAFVSAPVHASVSGKVTAIEERALLDGRKVSCIIIANDGRDEKAPSNGAALDKLSADQIREIVKNCGLVGMGGAGFPTHVKLAVPKPVDTVIINGAECEPYLTCDHRLMVERAEDMVQGLLATMKATRATKGIVGIEINKLDAIEAVKEAIKDIPALSIVPLQVRYPQGAEKQLIKAALGREVPSGSLPFEVGCVVSNVHTAISINDAITSGTGLYQRVVTISGRCILDPRNVMVRIGTTLAELAAFCGGVIDEPAVIVGGGPMTGPSVVDMNAPVVKTLSGLLFLAKDEAAFDENRPCLRCARCVDVCPMGLIPSALGMLSDKGKVSEAANLGLMDCIECSLCSFVCPSRRAIVSWIKGGKKELAAQKAKEKAV